MRYYNVEDYANTSPLGISVSQRIKATGGTFTLNHSLSWLHEFSRNANSYSTTPVFLSYTQSLMDGRKSMRFENRIQQLQKEHEERACVYTIAAEQESWALALVDACINGERLSLAEKDTVLADSLASIATKQMQLGRLTALEHSEIALQKVDAHLQRATALADYEESVRILTAKTNADGDVQTDVLSVDVLPNEMSYQEVTEYVSRFNPFLSSQRLEMESASYKRYTAKRSTRFNADISVSYGLNQYATSFADAYRHPAQCQTVNLTLQIPVFQWGINRNKRVMAENTLAMTQISQQGKEEELQETMHSLVMAYNHTRRTLDMTEQRCVLARQRVDAAVMQFAYGKVSAKDVATIERDALESTRAYLTAKREIFAAYCALRTISLFDFVANQPVSAQLSRFSI